MWYLFTVEYFSAIKKNENLSLTGKWMELEITMLSEVKSGSERQRSHVFSHMWKVDTNTNASIILYTYRYIYIYTHTYIYTYTYIQRESMFPK
jgi:hypothetical protein